MNKKKSDKDLLKIMDHFDGTAKGDVSQELMEEVDELKEVAESLRELPIENSDIKTDQQFYSFLESKKKETTSKSLRPLWPYVALVASLALILYLFLPKDLSEQYEALDTNSDKVGFIYDLNKEDIGKKEYLWLFSLLKTEENPNIRVTLIDLIEQQKEQLPPSIAQLLAYEDIPTVQMALLNTIDLNYSPEMKEHLLVFNDREDLDQLVKQRIADILNEN